MAGRFPTEAFDQLDRQARRQIASIHHQFAPYLAAGTDALTADGLALDVALVLTDLAALRESLRQYRDLIAAEIRQHNSAQSALAAYAKSLSAKARRVC